VTLIWERENNEKKILKRVKEAMAADADYGKRLRNKLHHF